MMENVKSLTSRSGGHDMILAAALPHIPDKTSDIANLREKQADLKEDLQKALATAQALQMAELIDQMEEGIDDSIDDANKGVDDSVSTTMSNAGYARHGDSYTRRTIIDSSLMGGPESEMHEVGAYNDFIAPDFDHGVDLSQASLEKLNSTLINVKVKKAQENLENYIGLIFGQKDAETDGLDSNFLAHLEAQQEAFENSAQYNTGYYDENDIWQETGKHTTTSGLFYFHVGYAPEMEEDDPEDVETEGYGEMGRIYEDFMIQQARMQRGFATVDLPAYSQKIWDDDADNDGSSDSLFGAPTIRSLTDIAVGIAANALAPGAGGIIMSAALNMVDDAVFTALDVQNGQMEAGDAWGGLAKKGATSLATSYVGGALGSGYGGNFEGLQSADIFQNSLIASTGLKATELTTNLALSNGINALDWDNGFKFDEKAFYKGFEGKEAWTGVIAGTAEHFARTSFQTGVFGNAFTLDNQIALKNSGWGSMAYNVGAIGNMAGSVTRGLTEYAMTGNTTANVLDFSMFGLKNSDKATYHGGLLELNLGNNGLSSRIGSGGIKADYSTLASFAEGMYVLGSERSIQNKVEAFTDNVNKYAANEQTAEDMARLNRMQRAYGNLAAKRQAASMMNLDTELRFDQDVDGKAETVLENGNRVVFLNNGVNMNDMASVVDMLVTLNHEAHRDGEISSDYSQKMETRQAVKGHITTLDKLMGDYGSTIFNGNDELLKDYVSYKTGGNDYVDGAYDSSADYWKLMEDGSIVWDGNFDLTDENDNIIRKYTGDTNSSTAALADHLGISRDEATALIISSGMTNYTDGTWRGANGISALMNRDIAINMSSSFTRDVKDISYSDIFNSRVITDSSTGMTGTIFDHNPVNIYNSLVDSGQMINPQYEALYKAIGADIADATFISPNLSYEDWKANNYIQDMPNLSVDDVYSGNKVSTAYNAVSSDGRYTHKGVDLATKTGTELNPMIYNNDSTVTYIGDNLKSKQGNYITIETPLNYTFKGQTINESLFSRYLHLDSVSVINKEGISSGLNMGTTGNTGQWDEKPYDPHLHFEVYTQQQSPYMNYLSKQNGGQAYLNDFRYDPFLFLHKDKYRFESDAYKYDF